MSPGKRVRVADVVRRRRTPRVDAMSALALVIPLVTVGVLALVQKPPVHDTTHAPSLTKLTSSTLVCPSAEPEAPEGWVSTASGASGDVKVGAGSESSTLSVSTGAVTRLTGTGPAVIQGGRRRSRPGCWACGPEPPRSPPRTAASRRRSSGSPASAPGRPTTRSSSWSTPTRVPPNADITLYGNRAFTRRQLHGITIPATPDGPARPRADRAEAGAAQCPGPGHPRPSRGARARPAHQPGHPPGHARVAAASGRPRPRQPADRPAPRQGPAHPPARQPRRRRGARPGQDHHRRHELRPGGVAADHDPRRAPRRRSR